MAKKPKKPKKQKTDASAEDGSEAPKKGKGGLIGQLALMLALGGASFATVLFLPSNEMPPAHGAADTADEEKADPEYDLNRETAFSALTPLTLTLQNGTRLLKIGITLETAYDADSIDPDDPKIKDAFTGYLRALKVDQVQDAAFMAQMRAQLLRRAQLIHGKDTVYSVLITDFLVR